MLRLLLMYVVVIILFAGLIHGRRRTTTTVPTVSTTPIAACPGLPPSACLPQPAIDCATYYVYDRVNGTGCVKSCSHSCCSTVEALLPTCPVSSPDDPYCVATNIVEYRINGRDCPVYCGCVPDCLRLIC